MRECFVRRSTYMNSRGEYSSNLKCMNIIIFYRSSKYRHRLPTLRRSARRKLFRLSLLYVKSKFWHCVAYSVVKKNVFYFFVFFFISIKNVFLWKKRFFICFFFVFFVFYFSLFFFYQYLAFYYLDSWLTPNYEYIYS